MIGRLDADRFELHEITRFRYSPRMKHGHLRWDLDALADGLRAGVSAASAHASSIGARLESVGVDSWGVDYALLDSRGTVIEEPICYRDDRTVGIMDDVFARVSRREIFGRTGIQFLPLNTLFQLAAHVRDGLPANAARLLMIPDLCHHLLCGSNVSERTNASTTQLMNVRSGTWDSMLFERLGLPRDLMP